MEISGIQGLLAIMREMAMEKTSSMWSKTKEAEMI
jgi:hypothetical protein